MTFDKSFCKLAVNALVDVSESEEEDQNIEAQGACPAETVDDGDEICIDLPISN